MAHFDFCTAPTIATGGILVNCAASLCAGVIEAAAGDNPYRLACSTSLEPQN